jgi:hypothetical protein
MIAEDAGSQRVWVARVDALTFAPLFNDLLDSHL